MTKRHYTFVSCKNCNNKWQKRTDTILKWSGLCKSCSMKLSSNTPEILIIKSINAKKQLLKQGGIPNAKLFTSEQVKGSANWNWKGGITSESLKIRHSKEIKEWRKAVFERDNYICVLCKKKNGDKHADHIKPFALYAELRFDINNGRTLCIPCHRKYGALVSHNKITREAVLTLN